MFNRIDDVRQIRVNKSIAPVGDEDDEEEQETNDEEQQQARLVPVNILLVDTSVMSAADFFLEYRGKDA